MWQDRTRDAAAATAATAPGSDRAYDTREEQRSNVNAPHQWKITPKLVYVIVTVMLELKPATPIEHDVGTGDGTALTVKPVAAGAGVAIVAMPLHDDALLTTRLLPKEPVQPS